MLRSISTTILRLLIVAVALVAMLVGAAALMRPRLLSVPEQHAPEKVAQAMALRDITFDAGKPVVIQRDVAYTDGSNAAWFPRIEPPACTGLVAKGALPRVAERTGPEPVVMEGVDGCGTYGGTWMRVAFSESDVGIVASRLSYVTLARYSVHGFPIVPHVAKSWEVSPDFREFTFHLRRGMRWSDGHPFTSEDIMFWWECEATDKMIYGAVPDIMKVQDTPGRIEKIDEYTLRFVFPHSNGMFIARLASSEGMAMLSTPAHYLRPLHPRVGDAQTITNMMRARSLASAPGVYGDAKNIFNPEHPRLWPWVFRTYRPNAPFVFVRNPYFWAVDTTGQQLPYIDRILFEVRDPKTIVVMASNGEVSMQERSLPYDQYTHLMSQREKGGYELYHWYPGDRASFLLAPNLNRRIDAWKPETALKHAVLNDKRFRQALSLAINRREIIEAEYGGQCTPAQCAPGPPSPFSNTNALYAFTEYAPERANRLLDEMGLTQRDYEGFRTFTNGARMTFYVDCSPYTGSGPAQFTVGDWARVGVRAIVRERSRALFYTEKDAGEHDFNVWGGNAEYMAILGPRWFVPMNEANYALGFGRWYQRGGLYGNPLASEAKSIEPPLDHPLRKAMELYEAVRAEGTFEGQHALMNKILDIGAENVWSINIATPPPVLVVVKNGFRNVPRNAVVTWELQTPGNAGIETYYFERPSDSVGARADIVAAIEKVTPRPMRVKAGSKASGGWLGAALRWLLALAVVCAIILTALRHPYIGHRLLIMIPTLLIISVVVFSLIQLPPGDYLTSRIMALQSSGDQSDQQQLEDLRRMFQFDQPAWKRYFHWVGATWFTTFKDEDRGLLQGSMGRSMETGQLVNDMVGDRIMLTVVVSLLSILFTWLVALPIGIYSAVRQYSFGDYVATFIGFVGMCIPSFLLALVLMYLSFEWFGVSAAGLFSSQYGAQPEWSWGKVLDLLRHVWVVVVVLGVGGTAHMIRVMRGNLLDELKKPYVVTARAKGVKPLRLLLKYPVRLALNPFISGIGGLFPALVSGGTIVAVVLGLPIVGPLMLSALLSEDMYLAGSMLMVLSLLGVFGTLVSDLLLLWLDPRIRFKGGSR